MTDDVSSTSALAIVRPTVLPSTAQFQIMRDLAIRLASAKGFLPAHYFLDDRGQAASGEEKMAKVLAAIEYGRAVGIEPMIALQNITMIKGKAGASAMLIGAQLRRAGYKIETSWYDKEGKPTPKESPDVWGCKVVVGKRGEPTGDGVFSLTDAQRAGLLKEDSGWQRYPKDMLYARALTQAAREGAQDAVLGMAYTAEELGGEADYDGNVETVKLPAASVTIEQEAVQGTTGVQPAPSPAESGVPEATGSLPVAAIQPASPAPSEGAPASSGGVAAEAAAQQPSGQSESVAAPPPTAPFNPAPLAGPSVSRRMGRSIGPQAKRTNVVTAEQGAEKPATVPEVPASTQISAEVVSSQPTPSALTDEPIPAEPVDDGHAIFVESLRTDLRQRAATLARLNAITRNHLVHSLKNEELEEVPPATPSNLSDESLQNLIERDFPGRTLETLGEAELQNRLELIEPFISKRRDVLKEKGITEE